MKGLEISEIRLSALENHNTIGSEYYSPEYLRPFKTLVKAPYARKTLADCCSLITDGDHGRADYAESGVPFVLSESVERGYVRLDRCRFITARHAATLSRSKLRVGDVLVTKTGVYFGNSAVVGPSLDGANTIAHVGILRPKSFIDPYYLSTFLNSRFGNSQLRRRGIKATRPEIKLMEFDDIMVPLVSDSFSMTVRSTVELGLRALRLVDELQRFAEDKLADSVGLRNWRPPEPLAYTRKASEIFAAGRFDAEFFDPGKTLVLERLTEFGACPLSDLVEVGTGFPWDSSRFIEDHSQVGEPFVRIRDCKPGTLDPADLDKLQSAYAKDQCQLKAKAGDLVVGMDGLKWFNASLLTGACYVNQRVAHLRVPDVPHMSSEFLLICLNSILGQRQLLRLMTIAQTVGHITLNDLRCLSIPRVPKETHDDITIKVRESHAARIRSRMLFRAAQTAVELAIEKSESEALSYLSQKLKP